tara:strand:+ start:4331 stop:4462 length:132 start_codon:yes stop_codon:yes gene_type:complete
MLPPIHRKGDFFQLLMPTPYPVKTPGLKVRAGSSPVQALLRID